MISKDKKNYNKVKRASKHHRYSESDGYLKSDHWKSFIKKYWNTHQSCELCGATKWMILKNGTKKEFKRRFVVHHKDYKHLYKERDEDVQGLCARCHNLAHNILRMKDSSDFIRELKQVVEKYFTYDLTREK